MKAWIKSNFFLFSVLLYIICFLVTKLTYFLHYDIPGFCRDTFGYYYPVIALLKGSLPVFDQRTPAYPLFLFGAEMAHLSTSRIFMAQSLISLATLICAQYLINKRLSFLNWPFLFTALIFYSSGKCLFFETYINPTGLFTWVILLVVFFLFIAFSSNRASHYLILSALYTVAVLLRPQAFFLIPVFGIVFLYNILRRNHKQNLALFAPLTVSVILFLGYNKLTFGSFSFSKFQVLPNIGSAIFFLDESGGYSPQTQAVIDSVNHTFTHDEKETIRNSYSYSKLTEIFTLENYNKFFLFWDVYQTNPDELKALAKNSRMKNFVPYCKFVAVNFINYFKVTGSDYFFYYNDLNRRKSAIEVGDHFTFFKDSEDTFRLIFHEYADQILQKTKLTKTGIVTSEDYMSNFPNEKIGIKLNHYYQVVYNKLFYNYAWVIFFWLTFFVSASLIILKIHDHHLLAIQLFFVTVLMNYILLSLTVTPVPRYIYPTEFFLYFYPVCFIFWAGNRFARKLTS